MVTIAGIIVVLGVVTGPTTNIVTTPGGINTSALPLFGFLVLPLLCAVSFLPPGWVFVVAAGNSLFTLLVLRVLPSSGELHHLVQVAFPGVVTPILLSQWIVAIIAYLWVRGAKQAIVRADRAEEIGKLLREVAQRDHRIAVQKAQLDASIQAIEQVHEQVANGNFTARVPLAPDNVLWSISGKLNFLVARLQRVQIEASSLRQRNVVLEQAHEHAMRLTRLRGNTGTASEQGNSEVKRPPTV